MNKSKLRGKRLNIVKPQTNYAKVPMEVLAHPELTPIDKIILSYLFSQSDSGRYILAYTRIAKELNISKKWVIERWKWLKEHRFILEDDQNYYITLGIDDAKRNEIMGKQNTPLPDTKFVEESTPNLKLEGEENTPLHDSPMVKLNHPLYEENTPNQVNLLHPNGEVATPNEHNKEEKKKTEQAIEPDKKISQAMKEYNLQDSYLKSIYFGETLNQKLLNAYFNSDIKNKISNYLQFENLYVYFVTHYYFQGKVDRAGFIKSLNSDFDKITPIVINNMTEKNIQSYLMKEKWVYQQNESFKL